MRLKLEEMITAYNQRHPDAPITHRALAAAVGIAPPRISEYKAGRRMPGAAMLKDLADALGCSTDDLIGD